jgi:putative heme-binding domain-containing protein
VQQTPAADASLRHTLRIALRNALALPGGFAKLPTGEKAESEIVSLMTSIATPEASGWLLDYLSKHPPQREVLAKSLSALARNLPESGQETLVKLVKSQFPENASAQIELLQTLLTGIRQHGVQPQPAVVAWAGDLAQQLATSLGQQDVSDWSGHTEIFALDSRPKEGGGELAVLTSLPPPRSREVEVKRGTILSRAFPCPAQLSFWICGHNGPPGQAATHKNYIRLVDATTSAEFAKAEPPRHDAAHQVQWKLQGHEGQSVRLEITDGDAGTAYAWLAVGGLEPPVVALSLGSDSQRWQQLAELTASFKLGKFAPILAAAFLREELQNASRQAMAQALTQFPDQTQLLADLFKNAPTRHQSLLAEMLATTLVGAEKLCVLAPARLLAQANIAQKLAALKQPALDAKLRELTKDLPPASAETEALLKRRLKGFLTAQAAGHVDAAAGKLIFTTNCAICHQLEGVGKQIGPQLEGTKNRGAERLCEDILDPNRAVDPNFHLHMVKLDDGSLIAGLQRREEGATLVVADIAGTEHTISKARIKENTESALSLMPPTFGQTIPEADYYHLLGYLLQH